MQDYDYSFSQNGLVAYKAGVLIAEQVSAAVSCVYCCVLLKQRGMPAWRLQQCMLRKNKKLLSTEHQHSSLICNLSEELYTAFNGTLLTACHPLYSFAICVAHAEQTLPPGSRRWRSKPVSCDSERSASSHAQFLPCCLSFQKLDYIKSNEKK